MPKNVHCAESYRPEIVKVEGETSGHLIESEVWLQVPAAVPNRTEPLFFRGQYIEQLSSFLWVRPTTNRSTDDNQGEVSCK